MADEFTLPLHTVHLQCDLASGFFKVPVCNALPVSGVNFILGNHIAGKEVQPVLLIVKRKSLWEQIPNSSFGHRKIKSSSSHGVMQGR